MSFLQTSERIEEKKHRPKKLPIIWLHIQECTGCTASFLYSGHPTAANLLLNHISLNYHETLTAASGEAIEQAKADTIKKYWGNYVLVVEGSIPQNEYFIAGGGNIVEQVQKAAEGAAMILAIGTCAAYGGLAAARPNPTGAMAVQQVISDKPVVQIPGCPPIPEVITGVIVQFFTSGTLPELDRRGRPKAFYSQRIHDICHRRSYFEAGLFAESLDDEGAKKGYCLFKLGCKGLAACNPCMQLGWYNGLSSPIDSGNPCVGCSEKNFWDRDPFFTRKKPVKR